MKEKITAGILLLLMAWLIGGTAIYEGTAFKTASARPVTETVPLLVCTYHQITAQPSENASDAVTAASFREDLTTLHLEGYTPVSAEDLLRFSEKKEPLPPKPVLLTFDDGYRSFCTEAFPILEETGTPAVFSVVGKFADYDSYQKEDSLSAAYADWTEIKKVSASGWVEIGNHSYALHTKGEEACALPYAPEIDLVSCSVSIMEQLNRPVRILAAPDTLSAEDLRNTADLFPIRLTETETQNRITFGEALPTLGRMHRCAYASMRELLKNYEKKSSSD